MKRTILIALVVTLPLTLCVPVLQAQGPNPHAAKDASQMQESGPTVVGGSGATAGPNYNNQAVVPIPGMKQQEELSELPPARPKIVPEVRPVTGAPPVKR
jgi:hypothetical protein